MPSYVSCINIFEKAKKKGLKSALINRAQNIFEIVKSCKLCELYKNF